MIGLQNIGQTCYMNAALQCFSNTDSLTNYFLNPNMSLYIENNPIKLSNPENTLLISEYQRLIKHLWCGNPKSNFAPYDFKESAGKLDSLFENFEANDSKDLINFMVLRLHEELNFVDSSFNKNNNIIPPSQPINQYDHNQVLQCYLYDFQMNNNSIISTIFYGTIQGEFECQNCKFQLFQMGQVYANIIKYNYQNYFFINFPLEEVRKYIIDNQSLFMNYTNNGINPNNQVNLIDCFNYYNEKKNI